MKHFKRLPLLKKAAGYLGKRQTDANTKHQQQKLNADNHWSSSRSTKSMAPVLETLQTMTGADQRCMYCLDSHGSDVEHFWPKSHYPDRMYQWENLLLCCAPCGRIKGVQFPLSNANPLLLNPTTDKPWESLDFDPETGIICARFDAQRNAYCPRGEATVEVLQLDRREALSRRYLKTLKRISKVVETALANTQMQAVILMEELEAADDHGLLGWCFGDRVGNLQPFHTLRQKHPAVWEECARVVGA